MRGPDPAPTGLGLTGNLRLYRRSSALAGDRTVWIQATGCMTKIVLQSRIRRPPLRRDALENLFTKVPFQ